MASLIELQGVHKSFGSLIVTDGMSFSINQGEALGVIGPNGAGKSTLFNLICGMVQPDQGTIIFDGKDIAQVSTSNRCHQGIGRTFQIPHPFEKMSVFENLIVGSIFGARLSESQANKVCGQLLEQTGLAPKRNQKAGSLTLLERKRLELARALATQPKLLLLDEIAGGLTEYECLELVKTIKEIHASGTAIIWIEHIVHALVAVVKRLIVIDFGKKLDDGEPTAVMDNPIVQEIYMGINIE